MKIDLCALQRNSSRIASDVGDCGRFSTTSHYRQSILTKSLGFLFDSQIRRRSESESSEAGSAGWMLWCAAQTRQARSTSARSRLFRRTLLALVRIEKGTTRMQDALMLLYTVIFFAVAFLYVKACQKLR
jgi:hypothetical protein